MRWPLWLRRVSVAGVMLATAAFGASTTVLPVRWWLVGLIALASLLFLSRDPRGVLAMVALVPLIAGIRRLVAGPSGYVANDPLILVPYALLAGPVAVWVFTRDRRPSAPAAMSATMSVIAVSAAVGVLRSPGSTAYAVLGHVLPLLVGMMVATQPGARLFHLVRTTIGWVGAPVVAYGFVQWVAPLPWDLAWLRDRQDELVSIGMPVTGEFRLFGTMASQAPYAFFLALCMVNYVLLALVDQQGKRVRRTAYVWLAAATTVPLALTSVRSALFAVPVVLLVVLLVTKRVPVPLTFAFTGLLAVGAVTLPLALGGPSGPVGTGRYDVGSITSDSSYQARAALLPQFSSVLSTPQGRGLGVATVDVSDPGGGVSNLDNGYLARGLEQGLAGVVVLLVVLCSALVRGVRAVGRAEPDADYALAVVLLFAIFELSVPTISGASGVFFWCAVGHVMSRQVPGATPSGSDQVPLPAPRGRRRRKGPVTTLATRRASSA